MRNAHAIIIFSKKDHKVPYKNNRKLCVTAVVNGVEFKRAFLDGSASINAMPYSVFKAAKIPKHRLVRQPIEVNGMGGEPRKTIGHVCINLYIGKIRSSIKFHVAGT